MNEQEPKNIEAKRIDVEVFEELAPENVDDLQAVSDILNDPVNSLHFTQAAKSVEDLQKLATRPEYHLLVACNKL